MTDAVPFPDGSKILHIGLQKTGTTALQSAMFAIKPELLEHGVHYAGNRRHHFRAATAAAIGNRSWYSRDMGRQWQRIAEEIRASDTRLTFFTSEALAKAGQQNAGAIIDAVGPGAQVVITTRPLASIIPSVFQMRVGAGLRASWPDFIDDVFSPEPSDAARAPLRGYALDRYLRVWGEHIGPENLTFVIVDPSDRGMLFRSFERLLGLPADVLRPQPRMHNNSLPFPELEMVRLLNRLDGADFLVGDNPQRHQGRMMRRVSANFDKHPIRITRAGAEACNAATKPWIEAVKASGANVVGSLDDLLVDPADYPETADVPTTVSTESAAEIAHFLEDYARQEVKRSTTEKASSKPAPPDAPSKSPAILDGVPASEIAKELRARLKRKLTRRLPRSHRE